MSFRAKMQRVVYIDNRLRYRRDYPSAAELAEDYFRRSGDEFSARTFKRDIEWLRDERAPIEYDASRHGYYYTHDDFQLPAIHLSEGDLMAILVAERALSSYRNSPYYEKLRSVFERLTHLLPNRVTVSSRELATDVSVIPEPVTTIGADVWTTLHDALERRRTVTIGYRSPAHESPSSRTIDPYHIVGYRGEWYLLGWSHKDDEVRVYALARIQRCSLEGDRFDVPEDFAPEEYIDPNFGIFVNEPWIDVAIRFEAPVARLIGERQWHPGQTVEALDDGAVVLRFRTNQHTPTLYWVSQWGPNAEVLEPAGLRERAADWFTRSAARYARGG